MKQLLQLALLVILFCANYGRTMQAQDIKPGEGNFRGIHTVVKEHGWKIPGLDETKILQPRKRYDPSSYSGYDIYLTRYELQHRYRENIIEYEVVTLLPFYYIETETNLLKIVEHTHRLEVINRFDFKGKPFCFVLDTTRLSYDPRTRMGGTLSGIWTVAYYDMDGDGKFETRELPAPSRPRLPRWVAASPAGDEK
jgi:hypothetical protein